MRGASESGGESEWWCTPPFGSRKADPSSRSELCNYVSAFFSERCGERDEGSEGRPLSAVGQEHMARKWQTGW